MSVLDSKPLAHVNLKHIDEVLLDSNGLLKVVDADLLRSFRFLELRLWARENGVYQFITTEMIDWLRTYFDGRKGLEICAGKGTIGRTLGIISTDSRLLQTNHGIVKSAMQQFNEQPTNPPDDVLTFESNAAVNHFKPQVVVGAFVSQLYKPGENWDKIPSSAFGTDEELLYKKVSTYIMFGNINVHKHKRLFKKQHREYFFPWLFTRCEDQSKNRVWVWTK
ncbi:hypothetical protein SAMN05428988_3153 [Chitinophaga sp. YR573]|uniref:hypothetical protein n=1 Tax=Chitinophaga sp. YR573 TaxID=1881040 RepID=UPI0008ADC36B|nr:hypothetical protein [Chitinophaga sp. YR573]SEW20953.1 hypothetical protein SAMN05428988_3153 [Chitinophaga sp. YR573]